MNNYKDLCLIDNNWIIDRIQWENNNQLLKWGEQSRTAFEWLTYLAEEFGELAQAINEHEYRDGKPEQIAKEAIQVATLALKIAEIFEDNI